MKSKLIVGSAMGLAALAVAIDHTKHKLPEPTQSEQAGIIISDSESESPCGLGGSPCGLDNESLCGLDGSPCGL